MYREVLCVVVVLLVGLAEVGGQADLSDSQTTDGQSLEDKALLLADALVKHPDLFRKLLKIIDAGRLLLDIGTDYPNVAFVKDYFLDILPKMLNSSGVGILNILVDELNRVNVSDVTADFQRRHLPFTDPAARQELLDTIKTRYNTSRAIRRVLSHRSARYYLPLTHNNDISASCYNDSMNFIDTLPGVQQPPREDLNYFTQSWAMHMLDSYGKPPSGILEGDLDWEGSVAECRGVHAHLDTGLIVGNRSLTSPVNFQGRYCVVTFSLSSQVVTFLNKFQKNLDYLRLGMCVPDSCSGQDVSQLVQLGVLQYLNMAPTSVSCLESGKTSQPGQSTSTHAPYSDLVTSPILFHMYNVCIDHDQGLDQRGWQQCLLSIFDADKNGAISKQEWSEVDDRDTRFRYFLQMDVNYDNEIGSTDLHYFFKFFDNGGDGQVDMFDFTFNWKSLFWTQLTPGYEGLVTSPVLYQLFNSCDSEGNGLNRDKWIHCFFNKVDTDKNGAISKTEWTAMDSRTNLARFFLLTDINKDLKIDATDLNYFFTLYDDNNDGTITLQEFTWNWKSVML